MGHIRDNTTDFAFVCMPHAIFWPNSQIMPLLQGNLPDTCTCKCLIERSALLDDAKLCCAKVQAGLFVVEKLEIEGMFL